MKSISKLKVKELKEELKQRNIDFADSDKKQDLVQVSFLRKINNFCKSCSVISLCETCLFLLLNAIEICAYFRRIFENVL